MIRYLIIFSLLLSACSDDKTEGTSTEKHITTTTVEISRDWKPIFDKYGVDGCFILYEPARTKNLVYNPERVDKQYSPASTFKIINSLIALESGVVPDTNYAFKWDGEKRYYDAWNRDLTLPEAIDVSAVWVYQIIARRVGEERMAKYVSDAGYGNKNIGGGIDRFWLDGDIRISAREQVKFLERFVNNQLPFSKNTMKTVKEIMVRERTDRYVVRAKTGWSGEIGWYVGWLEQKGTVYIFAMNIDLNTEEKLGTRQQITYDILRSEGLMESAD